MLVLHACRFARTDPRDDGVDHDACLHRSGASVYTQWLVGLAVLAFTVLGSAAWLAHILIQWSRKIARLETALAAQETPQGDLPTLARTGERELDRLVEALNATGARLNDERQRASAPQRLAAVGRLAAGLAHEIRNPIAAMRLKAENALSGDDGSRLKPAMQMILEQIGRLDALLRNLLTMTQRPQPRYADIDVSEFLKREVETHAELAAAKGVRLGIANAEPGTHLACFDPEQIGRALGNLILNAIQHTPEGGRVEISAHAANRRLSLRVNNTGPGVPDEVRERLFEPFVTGRADGTGLGLSIVRETARSASAARLA